MKFFVILTLLLLLAACQTDKDELLFNGSSENWSVELTVSVINGSENSKIELKYMGNELESVKSFNYNVENTDRGTSFGADNVTLDKDGIYTNDDLSSNGPTTKIEDMFNIKVDWNGDSEN